MADVRLRTLERLAARGGPSEGADLLRERIRLGLLEERRVEQAAYLGDVAARLITSTGRSCPICSQKLYETVEAGCIWGNCAVRPQPRTWTAGLMCVGAQSEELECDGILHSKRLTDIFKDQNLGGTCTFCNGTTKVTRPVPDTVFLMRCALAAARCASCVAYTCNCFPHIVIWGKRKHAEGCPIDAALIASEAWLKCPCEEHEGAWRKTLDGFDDAPPKWLAFPLASFMGHPNAAKSKGIYLGDVIKAAAESASLEAVRKAIEERVRPWLLGIVFETEQSEASKT